MQKEEGKTIEEVSEIPSKPAWIQAALILSVFLVSCAYLLWTINKPISFYDEGLIVTSALRITEGELPYKDFWSMYSPGQFYVLAFFFELFGKSILAERILSILIRAGLLVCVYCYARRAGSAFLAVFCWLVSLFTIGAYGFFGYPVFAGLLLSLAGLIFFLRFLSLYNAGSAPPRLGLTLSGMLMGLTVLFRHDIGLYLFIAEITAFIIYVFFHSNRNGLFAKFNSIRAIFILWPFFLGGSAVVLPALIYFMANAGCGVIVDDLLIFPTTIYPEVRSLPFPLSDQLFYFPIIVYLISVVTLFRRRGAADLTIGYRALLLATIFGILLLNVARVRPDTIHLLPGFLFSLLVLCIMLGMLFRRFPKTKILISVSVVAAVSFVLFPAFQVTKTLSTSKYWTWPESFSHGIERANHFKVWAPQAKAARYIKDHVPKRDRIFVGNTRHDLISANDIMFYFLAERRCAGRYHELHPGLATTLKVQKEIVHSLIENNVDYVVLAAGFEKSGENNKSATSSGITHLDRYIRDHYRTIRKFGPYRIMKRSM